MNGWADDRRRGAVQAGVAGVALLVVAVSVVTGWVDWGSVGRWARPRAVRLGLWLLGGLLVAGAGYSWWRARRPRPGHQARRSAPLSWWAVAAAALVITVVVWGATAWLLGEAATADDPGAARVEAIKTGLAIGGGTAGVFVLLLAVRRQWHQEITATDTVFDATERRVTELYTKAADQLGSDKAAVRLAGLYALKRLAQDHVEQRQTIVNVFCAYLRMPCELPGKRPADNARDKTLTKYRERVQEREVRLAVQRLLATHLQPGADPLYPADTFWADIDLDLTGATLIEIDLRGCRIRRANFNRTQFASLALFDEAQFTGYAWFMEAMFTGDAWFGDAQFAGDAWFKEAQFTGDAVFRKVQFTGVTSFRKVQFTGDASFKEAQFTGDTSFDETQFASIALFDEAQFASIAWFNEAQFTGDASFEEVQFTGYTSFKEAQFAADVPPEVARFVPPPDEDADDVDEIERKSNS